MFKVVMLAALLLMALAVVAAGCFWEEEAMTPTPVASPTVTPAPTLAPTPSPTPGPTTLSEVFNITDNLSGLNITLTVASWTGDEVEVEWTIHNSSGRSFSGDRLYSIFYPGTVATDQNGREGEYFVPMSIENDLANSASLHYETSWLFAPESEVITVKLADTFKDGSQFVDLSAEYVFWR
jgi:hypothetical protein